jgi:hypothetical protein
MVSSAGSGDGNAITPCLGENDVEPKTLSLDGEGSCEISLVRDPA